MKFNKYISQKDLYIFIFSTIYFAISLCVANYANFSTYVFTSLVTFFNFISRLLFVTPQYFVLFVLSVLLILLNRNRNSYKVIAFCWEFSFGIGTIWTILIIYLVNSS